MPSIVKQSPRKPDPQLKKTGGLFDKLVDVSQATNEQGLKIAFFGVSGSGKTRLASTFPKPMLHIVSSNSAAGETRSIKNVPGIKVWTIDDEAELQQLIQEQRETGYFKSVALDHVSGYSDVVLRKILSNSGRNSPVTGDWQDANALMKVRLSDMLSLPCHVIINSQQRTFNANEEGNMHELLTPNVSFGLSPGVAGWLAPAVDYMLHTFVRMGKRKTGGKIKVGDSHIDATEDRHEFCLRIAPHPIYNIKFRTVVGNEDNLPEVIVNPTYDKIVKLIEGK